MTYPVSSGLMLPADLSVTLPDGDTIRHILIGHPSNIRQTIHLLHNLHYVEVSQWSPLVEPVEPRLVLPLSDAEQISLLTRRL
ncbi:MAG: hypothetical protein AAFZ80_01115 [Cyanobacteria bacterium P01_A01_bin.105]